MTDLIERHLLWLTTNAREATVNKRARLLRHADGRLPWGIDQADETELLQYLSGWTGWSRYTYDSHLRGFYRWGVRHGHLTLDPMADIPKPPHGDVLPHPCEDHELAIALTAPAPYGRAMLLAARAGLRCGEIARARRRDLSRGRLRVLGKGGRIRNIPLDEAVLAAVADEPDWLLGMEVSPGWLTKHQRKVWRRLGLPESFRLHAARHWFATRLLESGATLREVQTALGHASPVTTAGYTQVTDSRLAAAVGRLPRVTAEPASIRLSGVLAA